jgi:hypothetical protein
VYTGTNASGDISSWRAPVAAVSEVSLRNTNAVNARVCHASAPSHAGRAVDRDPLCRASLTSYAPYRYLTIMEQRQLAASESTGSLCCTLLDRRSSIPLGGARITCVGRDNRVTRFDADRFGRFSSTMPEGVYDLVISARGYLSLLVRGVGVLAGHNQLVTRALVPGEGEDCEHEPAAALGGYITDRFGRPVANVTIHITSEDGEVAYTTRTDRDGAYLLNGILPQSYDLTLCAMERRLARELVAITNPRAFVRLDLRLMQI